MVFLNVLNKNYNNFPSMLNFFVRCSSDMICLYHFSVNVSRESLISWFSSAVNISFAPYAISNLGEKDKTS